MLNKLLSFVRQHDMLKPGDHVVCAVSGGADSIALLYAMLLLQQKLGITVSAAHFNHRLRGTESDADEAFVRSFCQKHKVALQVDSADVIPGKKGLEAAARKARYAFLKSLPGKLATAHTADDNAETVLMHMLRGTGLKGLGGIRPVYGQIIRPMLMVTRRDVIAFLQEHSLPHVSDSSNDSDQFLRNRLRHHVMPLLQQENPRLVESLSAMAQRLREDEQILSRLAEKQQTNDIQALREMPAGLRARVLSRFLEDSGVPEPEAEHVALAEKLLFSENPSAKANFPGGVTLSRCYGKIEKLIVTEIADQKILPIPGVVSIPELGLRIVCEPAEKLIDERDSFTVSPVGNIILRPRQTGDVLHRNCGTKKLKDLFIDRKIPASKRSSIPVLADDLGILGVYGFGSDRNRAATELPAVMIRFEHI